MASPFSIYSTGHSHSVSVCSAIAAGTGFPVVQPSPLLEGGMVTYGYLRGLLPTLRLAQYERRPWVYADRGYLKATNGDDYSGYFRLTVNAYQHHGRGMSDGRRWRELGIKLAPWRKSGRHIVVCPPGELFAECIGGFTTDEWLRSVLSQIKDATDRPVIVRQKQAARIHSLQEDLVGAHAVVTHMSNAATGALLEGVPVICTGPAAAQSMGSASIADIEEPYMPDDRERWASVLADNQWTLAEIRAGCANHLFGIGVEGFDGG